LNENNQRLKADLESELISRIFEQEEEEHVTELSSKELIHKIQGKNKA